MPFSFGYRRTLPSTPSTRRVPAGRCDRRLQHDRKCDDTVANAAPADCTASADIAVDLPGKTVAVTHAAAASVAPAADTERAAMLAALQKWGVKRLPGHRR